MSLSGAWWTGDRQPAGKALWWVSACVPQVSDGTLSCRSLLNPSRQHLALPGSVDGSAILSRPARAEAPDVLMPLPPALAETSPHLRMSLRGCWAPRGLLRKKRMERNSLVMAWRGISVYVMVGWFSRNTLCLVAWLGTRECMNLVTLPLNVSWFRSGRDSFTSLLHTAQTRP